MLQKYLTQVSSQEVKDWVNTTLNAYLTKKKNLENQSEIEHILDYLGSDAAPTRLRKMSYAQAKVGASKWVKTLQKKGKDIDDSSHLEVIKRYKDGFKLVRLVGEDAYKREGNLMSHCVASYYGKDTEVYSLRDEKNNPHCTIEVKREDHQVNQIKGKGNGSIHPKYIKKVLSILKHFNLEVREREMENLGYIYLLEHEEQIVKDALPKAVIFNYKSNPYLFKGC